MRGLVLGLPLALLLWLAIFAVVERAIDAAHRGELVVLHLRHDELSGVER